MRQMTGAILALMFIVTGCESTQEAKSVEKSGFLGNYSLLKEGKRSTLIQGADDQALWQYMNPDAAWRKYKKVQLDPVTVWLGPNSKMQEMTPEDRQRLANTLWSQLDGQLRKDYGMTNQLGPDVMRVQVAITEGEASNTTMAAVFTIVPQLSTLSTGTSLATGVAAFAASASAEIKVTDGATGTLLFAGVDRRGGTQNLRGATNSWHGVEEAYRFWAEKARYRLCQWRLDENCVEPKA
jgi:hypothetical protein